MDGVIQLQSRRAREARLSHAIGKNGYKLLIFLTISGGLGAIAVGMLVSWHRALLLIALALAFYVPGVWWKRYLSILPASGSDLTSRLSLDVLARLKPGTALAPPVAWDALSGHWQAFFIGNHLLLGRDLIKSQLGTSETELAAAFNTAIQLADRGQSPTVELGHVVGGLLLAAPGIRQLLTAQKAQPADVEATVDWLSHILATERRGKQRFGGIGRDWAFGFTPLLNRYGHNISQSIMKYGAHFGWLEASAGVRAIEAAFNNGTRAIVLVGEDGIGKTSSVQALAQRLIEGNTTPSLAYHQIIEINATDIVSRAQRQGDLEHIMISLTNEASHAGHIILFLDDAQLFFGGGPGSFDGTQILLSIIQARAVPLILALTPGDFQRLKSSNPSLANLLTPVVLQELPEPGVLRVLEDAALGLESRNRVMVAYEALKEAYRLSGRYEQDEAYPGKAIKLLEQAVNHADQRHVVDATSVQQAIEQTRGVPVSSASPVEADALLHLEDNIHHRMINQSHAVSVVANALRRARAGVTNPKRPIGSFLFLGPTGVGKTELAKSIAAIYFGAETSLIRLDMSEYQQPNDVQRLLGSGQGQTSSLLLSVRQQPFSVILLDEIEKAHPNVLNLLLQLLDEGQLTDSAGRPASFKDCIIIITSNAGAQIIRDKVSRGQSLESFAGQFADELIQSGQFKPELLNRFDEIVLFRPLTAAELGQVVQLMLGEINQTLHNQNISVELTPAAIAKIVATGNDPRLGARPMRRTLQKAVEDTVAQKILRGEAQPGSHIILDVPDLAI